jgi:hypothetical protein
MLLVIALLVVGDAVAAPPQPEVSAREGDAPGALPATAISGLEESNAELLKRHAEIWDLMGLSTAAKAELNEAVVSVNTGIHKNRSERPEAFEQATTRRRSDEPLTYQDFVSSHKRRFALLKISGPTQAELLAALDFTWKALHDPEVPSEKREAAEKIRDLMISMGGPPPCCDDSIFERAGMAD